LLASLLGLWPACFGYVLSFEPCLIFLRRAQQEASALIPARRPCAFPR
jgi:hypothetical protein